MPQLTLLGNGFFTVHANLEQLLQDDTRLAEAEELIWLVANAQTIRGAQFSCGTILFKGDDVVASDEFAAEHGIHRSYGKGDWNLVFFCSRCPLEKRQATMKIFVEEVPKMRARNDAYLAKLKAEHAA